MIEFLHRFRQNRLAVVGLIVIVLYAVLALAAPVAAPHDPYAMSADAMLAAPGAEYRLGADPFGRDIFSRLMYGARISLMVGAIAAGIALVAGTIMGLLAGYCGRWVDAVLSRIMDILFSFPDILLALVIMAILGPSTVNVMIAIGIVYTPIFARIARASTLSVKEAAFVEAARSMGVRPVMIMWRHILPNITAPLIIQTTLSFAFAILAEAALSFLGLGVEPDAPSWGIMLNEGKNWMEHAWWVAVFPGVAITLAVLSFNVLGDGLRDALDPKLRSRGA
jgi:peptide/nickel transport system permease protein